jgi:hypothetical protein
MGKYFAEPQYKKIMPIWVIKKQIYGF